MCDNSNVQDLCVDPKHDGHFTFLIRSSRAGLPMYRRSSWLLWSIVSPTTTTSLIHRPILSSVGYAATSSFVVRSNRNIAFSGRPHRLQLRGDARTKSRTSIPRFGGSIRKMTSDETRPAIDAEDDTAAVLAKPSTRSSTRSSTRKKTTAEAITTSKSPAAAAPKTAKEAGATKRKSAKEEEDKEDDATDDAEKAPRKKKAAATHQVQTERDEIPKLWDKEKAAQRGAYSKFQFHPPKQTAPNMKYAIAHFKPSRSLRGMLPASEHCSKILPTYSESLWIGTTWMCYACKKPSCKRVIWRILN
jgi:hypothetical protein